MKKPPQKICRSFRQDFPEFVARAEALNVSIQLSKQKRKYDQDRVFWLNGHRQLTGYTTNRDGRPFTHADAVANIDEQLTAIEEDRAAIAGLSAAERFARVMVELRKMTPQYRMIGNVQLPCGDTAYCFFNFDFDGAVRLKDIGEVARARVAGPHNETDAEKMARFCDALEADFAARAAQKDTEAA